MPVSVLVPLILSVPVTFAPVADATITSLTPPTPIVTLPPDVAISTLDVPFEIEERSRPIMFPAAIFDMPAPSPVIIPVETVMLPVKSKLAVSLSNVKAAEPPNDSSSLN